MYNQYTINPVNDVKNPVQISTLGVMGELALVVRNRSSYAIFISADGLGSPSWMVGPGKAQTIKILGGKQILAWMGVQSGIQNFAPQFATLDVTDQPIEVYGYVGNGFTRQSMRTVRNAIGGAGNGTFYYLGFNGLLDVIGGEQGSFGGIGLAPIPPGKKHHYVIVAGPNYCAGYAILWFSQPSIKGSAQAAIPRAITEFGTLRLDKANTQDSALMQFLAPASANGFQLYDFTAAGVPQTFDGAYITVQLGGLATTQYDITEVIEFWPEANPAV